VRSTVVATLVIGALGCTACSSGSSSAQSAEPSGAVRSMRDPSAYAGPVIPDGTYRHRLVADDLRRLGFPATAETRILGHDGHQLITLKFQGGRYTQFETVDDGAVETGDLGLLGYRTGHQVLMTSQSVGCPGCQQLWRWAYHHDAVTLRLVRDTVDPHHEIRTVRAVIEHTFTRVG